jgi:hypothetical protein
MVGTSTKRDGLFYQGLMKAKYNSKCWLRWKWMKSSHISAKFGPKLKSSKSFSNKLEWSGNSLKVLSPKDLKIYCMVQVSDYSRPYSDHFDNYLRRIAFALGSSFLYVCPWVMMYLEAACLCSRFRILPRQFPCQDQGEYSTCSSSCSHVP